MLLFALSRQYRKNKERVFKKKRFLSRDGSRFLFMKIKLHNISFLLFLTLAVVAHSEEYPEIPRLESREPLFVQYQGEVEQSQKDFIRTGEAAPGFYTYKAKASDTIFTLAARCSIWQETLATANSIGQSSEVLEGRTLYLPTANGLFIAEEPETSMELLLAASSGARIEELSPASYTLGGRVFYFIPGIRLSPTERAYFLDPSMVMPLSESVMTSGFGNRESPITGAWQFHRGVDLASPLGSPVMACKSGIVERVEKGSHVYGNYVMIRHSGGLESLYAHLGDILVTEGSSVATGEVIAKVGLTGLTTGPHLHFEITQNGSNVNPEAYME